MPFTEAAKNGMLDGQPVRQRITHLSLHSADPGLTGANEVTGGDPAYARAAVTATDFTAAAGGEIETVADEPFDGPASGACTHYGAWDGATFLGNGEVAPDQAFNAEGVYILKAGTKLHLNAVA